MRMLIIHHHPLPSKNSPVMGGGLRAHHIGQGLRQNGVDVYYLCKSHHPHQWDAIIQKTIAHLDPEVILCNQLEDASRLPPTDIPVIVDLYAPRLLEVAFAPDQHQTAAHILLALQRGDVFLLSNERQRWHWMGVFALAGIDVRQDPCLIVPLACEPKTPAPVTDLILVGGGIQWPWQNPLNDLQQVLACLDQHGRGVVHWYIGPNEELSLQHARLEIRPWTSRTQYREHLSQSTLALDIDAPSVERELALGFRHLEYLSCGLPILSTSNSALSHFAPKACLAGQDTSALLSKALQGSWYEKARRAAQRYANAHQPDTVVKPLLQWLQAPVLHSSNIGLLETAQAIHRDLKWRQAQHAQELQRLTTELQHKSALIDHLNQQIQQYNSTIHRLAASIDEIASFKKETARVLGNELHKERDRASVLQAENARLQAENAKKSAELLAMDQLRERLENDLDHLRIELNTPRKRFWS